MHECASTHACFMHLQTEQYLYVYACMFSQDEHVHVMDVNLMTKICDGNFYYDRKRMITVRDCSNKIMSYISTYLSVLTAHFITI